MALKFLDDATFAGNVSLGDDNELIFGAATDYKIYHNSTTNVNHISSLIDRQLSINANNIFLTNQANNSTFLQLNSTGATFSGDLTVSGGDITLGGTGRIIGVDTVSSGTDAANKNYVDTAVAGVPQGDITGVTAGNKLTGGGTSGTVTLGLASNNISQWTNDSGYTTNVGDITGVTAGTNLTGGGTSGTVTLNMATGGAGAATYGSTSNSTKIDTITLDAYGRVTAVATGATGQVNTVQDDGGSTINVSGSSTARTVAAVTGTVSSSSSNLATGAQIQTAINTAVTGVLKYDGTWNASTNSPTLSSGSGTVGEYYIVSVAGSTNLDGITDWAVGDWAVFSDQATDAWQKIDNTQVGNVTGSGSNTRLAVWNSASNITSDSGLTFNTSTNLLTIGGQVNWSGGSSAESNSAYDNMITAFSDSGSSTITLTLTQNDGGTLTTSFSNPQGTTTPSNTQTFTNKSGNISQWTNDSGYLTSAGSMSSWSLTADSGGSETITNGESVDIAGGTNITTSRSGSTVTITNGITNNNQLTNGRNFITAGGNISQFVNNSGYITASSTNTLTNKSGNISQWTNNSGYTTNVGDITAVNAGTGLSGGGSSGSVTLNVDYLGTDSIIKAAPTLTRSVATGDIILMADPTTGNVAETTVGALPFTNTSGDITAVVAGTGLSGGGTSGSVTLNNTITNNNQLTNGAGYTTYSGWNADGDSGSATVTSGGTLIFDGGTSQGITTLANNSGSGGTISFTLDIDNLATDTGVQTSDFLALAPSGGGTKKATIATILALAPQGDITNVSAGDGLSGGGSSGSVSLAVDSTVVRTSGNQSISGSKSFNSTVNVNSDLDMEGGNDILLSASGRISIDGDYGSAGKVLTSTGSAQEWATPASGGITGTGVSGRLPVFSGASTVLTSSGLTFNTGTKVFSATKIAYTPVQQFQGFFGFFFGVQPGNAIKLLNITGNSGTSNVSSPNVHGYYIAPQAGRIKQVVFRNVIDTPASHSTRIKIYKNGSNTYTSSYVTGSGTNSVGWYVDFDDINHDFNQYDRIQLAFQGSSSLTDWKSFSVTIIYQFEDYEY